MDIVRYFFMWLLFVTELLHTIDRCDNTSEDYPGDDSIDMFDTFFCDIFIRDFFGDFWKRHRRSVRIRRKYSIYISHFQIFYSPIFIVFEKKEIFGTWIMMVL